MLRKSETLIFNIFCLFFLLPLLLLYYPSVPMPCSYEWQKGTWCPMKNASLEDDNVWEFLQLGHGLILCWNKHVSWHYHLALGQVQSYVILRNKARASEHKSGAEAVFPNKLVFQSWVIFQLRSFVSLLILRLNKVIFTINKRYVCCERNQCAVFWAADWKCSIQVLYIMPLFGTWVWPLTIKVFIWQILAQNCSF